MMTMTTRSLRQSCIHKRQRQEEKDLSHGILPSRGRREETKKKRHATRTKQNGEELVLRDLPAMATNRKNIHVSMSLPVEKKPPLLLPDGKTRLSITRRDASLILTLEITLLLLPRFFDSEDAYAPTDSRRTARITEKSLERRARGRARARASRLSPNFTRVSTESVLPRSNVPLSYRILRILLARGSSHERTDEQTKR